MKKVWECVPAPLQHWGGSCPGGSWSWVAFVVGGSCRDGSFPVSSEISDFTPCAHAQSNILHIKYAEKTDD